MLVLLEGNIAAGKTTLGEALPDSFAFVPEPVSRWQTGFAANLLGRFYNDTPRWAFTMQIGAFVTRAETFTNLPASPVVVFERSIYCDRYVFAKSLYQQGQMDETEWALYCHFWEFLSGVVPVPDAIIYLRTPAEECYRRLQIRGRAEEKNISLDYLRQLEVAHDEWLLAPGSTPVVLLDGMQPWTVNEIQQKLTQTLSQPAAENE